MSTTTTTRPKLGLALSGGGFRAAFFHLGVLARLAERGRLRRVEVISTVSGGSIIGALYYIHLRDLLQTEENPTDAHYVQIVQRMEGDFLAATEKNIRALATADLMKNFRMAKRNYSRSDRLGELYDELLYRPAWNNPIFGDPPPQPRTDAIRMLDLKVQPAGHPGDFHPDENVDREVPVPILVINATSLNTGHNWRFEAVAMGEDGRVGEHWVEIDKNARFLRTDYADIHHPKHSQFKLGNAVAASACVPGLFHPLSINDLFEGRRIELVDGGVHDNQGVCGLFDANCKQLIVSDAAGQMGDRDKPSTRIPAAVGRSTQGVFGDRVREEQLSDAWRHYDSLIVHLRRGLPAMTYYPRPAQGQPQTKPTKAGERSYGVHADAARLIAGTRTDLDAFSEVEAYSLAAYGYAMTGAELTAQSHATPTAEGEWAFSALTAPLAQPSDGLLRQLETAAVGFFKAARVNQLARALQIVLGLVALVAAGALLYGLAQLPGWLLVAIAVGAAGLTGLYFAGEIKPRWLRWLNHVGDFAFTRVGPLVLAPVLWVFADLTLLLTPAFLRAGRVERVLAEEPHAEAVASAPATGG